MMRPTLLVFAALLVATPLARASDCSRDSTGLVPLIDLGAGLYQGFEGGLYAGGSNHRPGTHDAAGVAIASAMAPLDTLGNPDLVNGRFVLVSIGMSNATQEFSAFVPKAMGDAARHPKLVVIDCARGGQATQNIRHPDAAYWDTVATRLRGRGSAPAQVQAVWIKEARSGPTQSFPASAESLTNDLGAIVRILKEKLPNAKLAYFTSRIYAGYATTALNPEPFAYEAGFATKWLIDAQITGEDSLNFDPGAGAVEAPWLAWGPYLWADGLEGRSDGMVWNCAHFSADGTHPSASGRNVVADSLLAFFKADHTTVPWFVNPAPLSVDASPGAELRLSLAPNPSLERAVVSFRTRAGEPWRLDAFDLGGRQVRDLGAGVGAGESIARAWDLRDSVGGRLPPGVYWVRLASAARVVTARLAVLGGP